MPSYTAPHARWLFRLLCLLAAWRLMSGDYAGVLVASDLSGNYSPFGDAVVSALRAVTGSERSLKVLQIALAVAWLAGGWWRIRPLVAVAWVGTAMFNLTMAHFVQPMFEFDLPLALTAIAICWPGSWRGCFSSDVAGSDERATWLLRSWLAYTTICYSFTGLSKLEFSPDWITEVGLADLYQYAQIGEFTEFPRWLDPVAVQFQKVFMAHPWLDRGSAALSLGAELGAPLALAGGIFRWPLPALLAVMHVVIWLACGMIFTEMSLVIVTFACLHWKRRSLDPAEGRRRWAGAAVFVAAILLALAPGLIRKSFPPFLSYRVFGWSYKQLVEEYGKVQYALGYREPGRQTYRPLPITYGGYKEYTVSVVASWALRIIVENPDDRGLVRYNSRLLAKCVQSIRPHESNSTMLGWLAMPQRFTTATPEVPLSYLKKNLFLLKGEPDTTASAQTTFGMVWKPIGEFLPHRHRPVHLYERDTTQNDGRPPSLAR